MQKKKNYAEADTGYFVAKGTLDRLYLSKFGSNVHQIYSVRHTTTHTVLSRDRPGPEVQWENSILILR